MYQYNPNKFSHNWGQAPQFVRSTRSRVLTASDLNPKVKVASVGPTSPLSTIPEAAESKIKMWHILLGGTALIGVALFIKKRKK